MLLLPLLQGGGASARALAVRPQLLHPGASTLLCKEEQHQAGRCIEGWALCGAPRHQHPGLLNWYISTQGRQRV